MLSGRYVPLVASILGLSTFVGPAAADCRDPFADPDRVLDLHLRLSRSDWDAMRNGAPVGAGCEAQYAFHRAEFRCGTTDPWQSIGVRRKRGDQRGQDAPQKPPIKLDINHVVAGQSWPPGQGDAGFRKLSLNNGQSDNPGGIAPSLLSEQVAWRLMRKELPYASGSVYARLTVHFTGEAAPQYHGLYILLEDIDRGAVRKRLGDAAGRLLKTTGPSLLGGAVCRDEVVFDDGGTNESATRFGRWVTSTAYTSSPATWPAETEKVLELDPLLVQEALRDVLGNNNDTVMGTNVNNHLAFDPVVGKRLYLPWDFDDTFGRGDGSITTNLPVTLPIVPSCSEVGKRTRCQPALKQRYLQTMCRMINGSLAVDAILAELQKTDALVRPLLPAEAATVWSGRDPLGSMPVTYATEYQKLRTWITGRIPEVRRQIQAAGVACAEGCQDGATEPCSYLSCPGQRTCRAGRWSACEKKAVAEVCDNGRDDTCDGQVDEGCAPRNDDGGSRPPPASLDASGSDARPATPDTGAADTATPAGAMADGGRIVPRDAGVSTDDAAASPASPADGCACRLGARRERGGLLLPLLLGALLAVRRATGRGRR